MTTSINDIALNLLIGIIASLIGSVLYGIIKSFISSKPKGISNYILHIIPKFYDIFHYIFYVIFS